LFTICSIFTSSAVRIVSSETDTATMTATSASCGAEGVVGHRGLSFGGVRSPVFIDATLPEQ
jgi:hypothetical protein